MTRVRSNQVHFYNRIDGEREDFTADQFTAIENDTWPVEYDDTVALLVDTMEYTDSHQVESLMTAFEAAYPVAMASSRTSGSDDERP